MKSIFSRIFRYRQREGRTPRENFFTETFADIVSKPTLFRDVFVRWLFELEPEDIRPIKIVTHRYFNQGTPDICVEVQGTDNMSYVAIIESKIDSRERENQLNDYGSILLNNWPVAKQKILVYITKYSEEIKGIKNFNNIDFRQRKWSNLYKTFAEAKQYSPEKVGALEHELLNLMEDWQMDGNIKSAHLRSLITCVNTGVGERLTDIQIEAWTDSGLKEVWTNKEKHNRWNKGEKWQGGLYTSPLLHYGVRIWMGFRFDRRDSGWNVDDLEIPCPAVSLANVNAANNMFPQPKNWASPNNCTDPDDSEFFAGELWFRQPTQEEILKIPKYGGSLYDYYRNFFVSAFIEISKVLNQMDQ